MDIKTELDLRDSGLLPRGASLVYVLPAPLLIFYAFGIIDEYLVCAFEHFSSFLNLIVAEYFSFVLKLVEKDFAIFVHVVIKELAVRGDRVVVGFTRALSRAKYRPKPIRWLS